MRAFADAVLRRRRLVLVAWFALLAAGAQFAGRLDEVLQGGTDQIPGSESDRVTRSLNRAFGPGSSFQLLVVMRNDSVATDDPAWAAAVTDLSDSLHARHGVRAVRSWWNTSLPELLGKDRHSALVIVTPNTRSFFETEMMTEDLRRTVHAGLPQEFDGFVTGTIAMLRDLDLDSAADLLAAERVGLPLTLLILLAVFGAPLAALLPVVLALAAVTLSFAGLYFVGHRVPASVFAENTVTMIGLGVGIDYALFILSRFRLELAAGHGSREAASRAVAGAGRAVLFSGATVAAGFLALFLVNAPFLHAIALGGTCVVATAVAASLTLLPALLAWLGPAVNWPRRPRRGEAAGGERGAGPWGRWALLVMKRPWAFLLAGMPVLLLFLVPVSRLRTWSIGASNLPRESEARRGYELLAERFQRGWMGPVTLLLQAAPGHTVWEERSRQAVLDLAERLAADPRVSDVVGFPQLAALVGQASASVESLADLPEPVRDVAADVVSADGRTAQMSVVTRLEPQSRDARVHLEQLKRGGFAEVEAAGLRVSVGGATASLADFDRELMGSLPRVAAAVLALIFLVLMALFRSLVIPLKAIVLNLLSVLAAYGFLVLVFQEGAGATLLRLEPPGGLNSFIVLMLFTILFGLSMDYEVFLLSQVRDEYQAGGDTRAAVAAGLEKTAGIITSAALIMISIFVSFGLTRMIATREFGLGLAFAVALDATLIRIVLVPALMVLAGPWNWWLPGRSRKR